MRSAFIMSSERSGSNLVRKMLGSHSKVAAPPPPHMWTHLSRIAPCFGSLSDADNLDGLLRAAAAMINVPNSHLAWGYDADLDVVRSLIKTPNLSGVISALHEDYAIRLDKSFWVCKENSLYMHAHQIREALPDTRFIYLTRDGRDYAASIKKVPTHDQHIFFIAREWHTEQFMCINVYQDLASHGCITLLRYEELIENPERELRRLCDFLELDYEPEMLAYHETRDARDDAHKTDYWKNLSRPVMSSNKAKFTTELSADEISLFEYVARSSLTVLGYPLFSPQPLRGLPRWRRLAFYARNYVSKFRNRRVLLEESGRVERTQALKTLRDNAEANVRPLADPISYHVP
jgi:hypothetical protein